MTSWSTHIKPVGILEWRHGGHRLAYVAAIVDGAAASGRRAVLLTDKETLGSPEFSVHLSENKNQDTRVSKQRIGTVAGMLASLRWLRSNAEITVVPEADRFLATLILAWLVRALPRNTSVIVMRPPVLQRASGHSFKRRQVDSVVVAATGLLKTALMLVCQRISSIDMFLLEDPVATGAQRVWGWPFSSETLRLDDPSDLIPAGRGIQPVELGSARRDRRVIAIVGSIDSRKQVPLLLRAWESVDKSGEPLLLLAGPHERQVRELVDQQRVADKSILSIDRYLTNEEMAGVIERSSGLAILYDGGVSSGILTTAVAVGRWVITTENTRTGAIAEANGCAVACNGRPDSLANAIDRVIVAPSQPPGHDLPTRLDFARRLLPSLMPIGPEFLEHWKER